MLMGLTERLQVVELLSSSDHLGDHILYLFRRISEIIDGREDLTAEIAPIEF
jgi:plasmid maintenance system antidote protein VapI